MISTRFAPFVLVTMLAAPAQAQDDMLASARIAAAAPADAVGTAEGRDWFGQRPWSEWSTVTGDWNTARLWLNMHGLGVTLAETTDVSSVRPADGRRLVTRGLFNLGVTADDAVLRVPGANAFVELQWAPGSNAMDVFTAPQGISNIDAGDMLLVSELWYEQRFGSRVRARVGRVDASDFLMPAMGFSPSIVAMTSYPNPASGVSAYVEPVRGVEVGGGVFNGSPADGRWIGWDSRFAIAQVAAAWTLPGTSLGGRVTSGGWRYHDFNGESADTAGVYVTAEQALWVDAERGTSAFMQFGSSDTDSPVRRHIGGGLSTRGVSRRRPLDVTGVGVTYIRFFTEANVEDSDLAFEAFHRFVLTPSISVIPDVNVLGSPDGHAGRARSAAFTCRIRFDF
jgi:carbohydrate-selective porin OprB